MVNAQEWLDKNYPKDGVSIINDWRSRNNKGKKREEITELELRIYGDLESHLDLSDFINLEKLDCSNNKLVNLDIRKCKNLKEFKCRSNKITSLDVSKNIKLVRLECSSNLLTCLNLGNNSKLVYLDCSFNQLSNLIINKKNDQLEEIVVFVNRISANLDMFSHLTKLKTLNLGSDEDKIHNNFFGSLKSLENLKNLESINIEKCGRITEGLEYLPTDNLVNFNFFETIFDEIFSPPESNRIDSWRWKVREQQKSEIIKKIYKVLLKNKTNQEQELEEKKLDPKRTAFQRIFLLYDYNILNNWCYGVDAWSSEEQRKQQKQKIEIVKKIYKVLSENQQESNSENKNKKIESLQLYKERKKYSETDKERTFEDWKADFLKEIGYAEEQTGILREDIFEDNYWWKIKEEINELEIKSKLNQGDEEFRKKILWEGLDKQIIEIVNNFREEELDNIYFSYLNNMIFKLKQSTEKVRLANSVKNFSEIYYKPLANSGMVSFSISSNGKLSIDSVDNLLSKLEKSKEEAKTIIKNLQVYQRVQKSYIINPSAPRTLFISSPSFFQKGHYVLEEDLQDESVSYTEKTLWNIYQERQEEIEKLISKFYEVLDEEHYSNHFDLNKLSYLLNSEELEAEEYNSEIWHYNQLNKFERKFKEIENEEQKNIKEIKVYKERIRKLQKKLLEEKGQSNYSLSSHSFPSSYSQTQNFQEEKKELLERVTNLQKKLKETETKLQKQLEENERKKESWKSLRENDKKQIEKLSLIRDEKEPERRNLKLRGRVYELREQIAKGKAIILINELETKAELDELLASSNKLDSPLSNSGGFWFETTKKDKKEEKTKKLLEMLSRDEFSWEVEITTADSEYDYWEDERWEYLEEQKQREELDKGKVHELDSLEERLSRAEINILDEGDLVQKFEKSQLKFDGIKQQFQDKIENDDLEKLLDCWNWFDKETNQSGYYDSTSEDKDSCGYYASTNDHSAFVLLSSDNKVRRKNQKFFIYSDTVRYEEQEREKEKQRGYSRKIWVESKTIIKEFRNKVNKEDLETLWRNYHEYVTTQESLIHNLYHKLCWKIDKIKSGFFSKIKEDDDFLKILEEFKIIGEKINSPLDYGINEEDWNRLQKSRKEVFWTIFRELMKKINKQVKEKTSASEQQLKAQVEVLSKSPY